MDPTTTVVLMTLNLAVTGALVALIAHRTPGQQPLLYCAASTWLFAAGFLLRLTLGIDSGHGLVLMADVAMVLAAGLFLHGQRRYLLQVQASLQPWLALAAGFALAQMTVTELLGQQGRHVLLNSTLALQYFGMAGLAGLGWRRLPPAERPTQGLMFGVAAVLGLATALRAFDAATRGVDTLFSGPTAQAYYALSSICILLMGPSVLWWMYVRLNDRLERLAIHDPLTGALNRNGLLQAVRRHFAVRTPPPLVWLLADLDHFKSVNDLHGHSTGDRLLKTVAAALMGHVRGGDFVARLGGEEFVVAVCGLDQTQALALAERLRAEVAAIAMPLADGRTLHCTVSLGVSPPFTDPLAWEASLQAADDALYRAKRGGRNRVEVGAPMAAPA